jgi:hypothetical protein
LISWGVTSQQAVSRTLGSSRLPLPSAKQTRRPRKQKSEPARGGVSLLL